METRSRWRQLLDELKRRKVWRVAVVYATTAFVVVQVADLTFQRLTLPPWTVTLVVVLALVGFPIAVVLAWAFEVTPDGVQRTETSSETASRPLRTEVIFAAAAGVALLGAAGWWLQAADGRSGAAVERLAVLPLANLMDDADQAYFVQGMHDRLIAELQEAGVPVIARTSVMRYGDGEVPARQIARELDVDALVEGTVFRAGDSVAIDARLVDPTTEEYLWSASFGGSLADVVALHRELTAAIADEIQAALAPEAEARLAEAPRVDPDAYEAYLKGEFHLQRFNPEDFATALEFYERALAIDSTYAPAYLGIARVWSFRAQATVVTGVTADQAREHWSPALERALALDSTLAGAHAMRATTTAWGDWRFREAAELFRRALELNPGLARQRMFYAHLLTILGDWEEARRQAERAVELDPLNPFVQGLYGVHLNLTRRFAGAIEVLEEMFHKDPGAGFGKFPLAQAYEGAGRWEDALRMQKELARERGESGLVTLLQRGWREGGGGESGYREAARRAADHLAERARDGQRLPAGIGQLYVSAGEEEKALEWLERSVERRNQNMPYVGVDPDLEGLHDHPRFRALARRIGVPLVRVDEDGAVTVTEWEGA
jgi:TolB-like protein